MLSPVFVIFTKVKAQNKSVTNLYLRKKGSIFLPKKELAKLL